MWDFILWLHHWEVFLGHIFLGCVVLTALLAMIFTLLGGGLNGR